MIGLAIIAFTPKTKTGSFTEKVSDDTTDAIIIVSPNAKANAAAMDQKFLRNSVTWTAVVDGFGYSWQDPHDADRAENFRYDRETGRCYYWYMPFYPD